MEWRTGEDTDLIVPTRSMWANVVSTRDGLSLIDNTCSKTMHLSDHYSSTTSLNPGSTLPTPSRIPTIPPTPQSRPGTPIYLPHPFLVRPAHFLQTRISILRRTSSSHMLTGPRPVKTFLLQALDLSKSSIKLFLQLICLVMLCLRVVVGFVEGV